MQFNPDADYKKLLTDLIKKQIVILGPSITLVKARNVKGLTVADDGTVTEISGRPQEIIQGLIDQFMQLSGLIVKKTMEPLLAAYPDGVSAEPQPLNQQETPPPLQATTQETQKTPTDQVSQTNNPSQ